MKNIKTYEEYRGQTFKEYLSNNLTIDPYQSSVDCSHENLIDLDGVDVFENMTELWCNRNKIKSLEGVKDLKYLTKIVLAQNNLTSLKGIENLTNLNYLSCWCNEITSLNGIENLTKLESLYCRINPIYWVDYIDKDGRTYYIKLPKSIKELSCDKFENIKEYWEFMDKNQPSGISRKFNF